jgi:hypothetical protein
MDINLSLKDFVTLEYLSRLDHLVEKGGQKGRKLKININPRRAVEVFFPHLVFLLVATATKG